MLRDADRDWLAALCAERGHRHHFRRGLSRLSARRRRPDAASFSGEARALTFVLGGLSKSAGLPQMKLGWIAVSGPDALADSGDRASSR